MTENQSTQTKVWNRYSRRDRAWHIATTILTLAAVAWAGVGADIKWYYVTSAPSQFFGLYDRMWPPDLAYISEIIGPLIETIHMAVLGTVLAIILAAPVALLAAENLSPNRFTLFLGKLITSASRSVNAIIWALLTMILFGTGALAGVIALGVRSIGFCAKLISEEIEEIDRGQVEAVKATGAGPAKTLIYGVVPQIKPTIVGVSVYRWEINIRGATILGLVGAGGIGVPLDESIQLFRWDQTMTILLAILGLVIVGEATSAYLRGKVR